MSSAVLPFSAFVCSARPWRVCSSCSERTREKGELITAGPVVDVTVLDRERALAGTLVLEMRLAFPPVLAAAAGCVPGTMISPVS